MADSDLGRGIIEAGRLFDGRGLVALGEAQLLDRFEAGDPAALEALIRWHGPMVLGVCRRILEDPHDVDDAFQVTFLTLVQKKHAIRNRARLAAWLHGVARRVAIRSRAEARRRRVRERAAPSPGFMPPSPGEGVERAELRGVLDEELARLPERYRNALVLCDFEGRTHEDAAAQLHCPVGTIKSRLSRGRDRLRTRLARRGLEPAGGLPIAPAGVAAVPAALASQTLRMATELWRAGRVGGVGAGSARVAALLKRSGFAGGHPPLRLTVAALLGVGLMAGVIGVQLVNSTPPDARAARPAPLVVDPPLRRQESDGVERFTLANGLPVILRPIPGAGSTALVVLYAVGNDHDPAGRSGLAHLAEHVYLTAAAGTTSARTYDKIARDHPAGSNGQTGDRSTVFAATFAPDQLAAELGDAAARMGRLRIAPADLDRERPRLVQEITNMFTGVPALAAVNNARELLRPTPDSGRRGGQPDQVRSITTTELRSHLARFYQPRNAIVALAGAFDSAQARRLIEEHFERLPPGEPAPLPRQPGPARRGMAQQVATTAHGFLARETACLAYLAPLPGDDLYAPFLVQVARLWAQAGKLAGQSPVYYTPLDDGAILAVTSPTLLTGETSRQAFDRLERFVAEATSPELGAGESEAAATTLGGFFQTIPVPDEKLAANPYGVAFALGRRAQLGIDSARFNAELRGVTPATVRLVANRYFHPSQHVAVFVRK